jgi:meso-butanediol dehydrogenase/(S,S)-butanediol dehydrogenase/diacetyl reductase
VSIIVVTGASSGIGAAAAGRLREAGHTVIEWDLVQPQDAVDVASTASVEEAVKRLPERLDGAVLAAGVSEMAPLLDTSEAAWRRQMDVNAFGVFNCLKALVPRMGPGGSIAVIASVAGFKAAPLLSAYVASKFAVVGLVKSAAMEFGPQGIRVNAVCPGFIHTPMQDREVVWEGKLRGLDPEAVRREYVDMTPLGRLGEPGDVADVVGYLMTPESRFMTGALLTISGGADL